MENQSLKTLSLLGAHITFLTTSQETGGAWSLIEYVAPPEFKGPAPHFHMQTSEAFYILEGQLRVQIGESVKEAAAGDFVLVQPTAIHAWSNPHPVACKFLVLLSPAGLEKYFEELAVLMQQETSWPPADMSKISALAEKFDTFSPAGNK